MRRTITANGAVRGQRGISLIVTLVILTIVTLGSIALIRSVDTGNLIAGNLASRQGARLSAERGIERAILRLEDLRRLNPGALHNELPGEGYHASIGNDQTIINWGNAQALGDDAAAGLRGNLVEYTIERLCVAANAPSTSTCVYTKTTACGAGGSQGASSGGGPAVCFRYHYRITARVQTPRDRANGSPASVTVQSIVAL